MCDSEPLPMNDYEWDVFISYRRFQKWKVWIDKYFKPLLFEALQPELRKTDVKIFVDRDDLVEGARWPDNLRLALAHARILVPLICAGYWDTAWCRRELTIMLEREASCGFHAPGSTRAMIVPVIIHDGERIPDAFRPVHRFRAQPTHVRSHLSSKSGLESFVEKVAKRIGEHSRACPPFDPGWADVTGDSFMRQLEPKAVANPFPALA